MRDAITVCPGCGQRSSEDYDGAGTCWRCHRAGTAEQPTASWIDGVPMDPLATPAESVPALPGIPFIPPGVGALIVGPTGGGRSMLVETCAYQAGKAGLRFAYLGQEITGDEFNARAAKLAEIRGDQIDPDLLAALANVRYLDLSSTIAQAWADPEAWVAGITERYAVVAIDPLSAVESTLGLNFEQSNNDYITFYDRLVQPLTAKGTAVIKVDNVGHALEAKARAKGASAKQDRADLTFSCSLLASPVGLLIRAGKVRSTRSPVRRGDEWVFLRDTQVIERRQRETDDAETAAAFRPTIQMERISRELEQAAGRLSKRAIRSLVPGRNEYKDLALNLLVSAGHVDRDDDGYGSNRPYREADDEGACPDRAPEGVPTVPTVPQACPDRAQPPPGGCAPRAFTKGHGGTPDIGRTDDELQALVDGEAA